jgi:hypothetical protein
MFLRKRPPFPAGKAGTAAQLFLQLSLAMAAYCLQEKKKDVALAVALARRLADELQNVVEMTPADVDDAAQHLLKIGQHTQD